MTSRGRSRRRSPPPRAAKFASRDAPGRQTTGPWGPWLWLLRLGLVLGAPLLLLLAAESGLRLAGYGYPTNLALPAPGSDTYGANMRFGWRFFPRAIARVPLLFSFARQKPVNTTRIFVLGASAAQGYPDGAFSFARVLEAMLHLRFPEREFEFINTAIVATNSHVVLPIARETARYQPDLFIVYLGNNEVIGPYGIGSSATRPAGGLTQVRLGIRLRTTKIGQLLQRFADRVSGRDEILAKWGGMEMYAQNFIAADDARLLKVYDYFQRNLADICRAAGRADAPVILCTVPVNLRDCAPFSSLHRPKLAAADSLQWVDIYERANQAAEAGSLAQALALYEAAAAIDDGFGELHFRWGRCLLAAGDESRADQHFLHARDLDALRFRADSRLNEIIRDVAASEPGVSLVDAAALFRSTRKDSGAAPAKELFFEHVHPTFAGNYLLAGAVYPVAIELLSLAPAQDSAGYAGADGPGASAPMDTRALAVLPSLADCSRELCYTEWNEYRMLNTILVLINEYPFPNQYDHAEKVAQLQQQLQWLKDRASQEIMRETYEAYLRAVRERPGDILLRQDYIELLKETGQREEAVREMARLMRTQPVVDWWQPPAPAP
jgi:tetratricopeptide (TPR) repeat protein